MQKILAAVLAAALAANAAADSYDYCRQPRAVLNNDDYHRIKGLLRGFKHAIHESGGKAYISFVDDADWPQSAILRERLAHYGGLQCRQAEHYSRAYSQKLADGSFVDCIVIDLPKFNELSCDWQNRRNP